MINILYFKVLYRAGKDCEGAISTVHDSRFWWDLGKVGNSPVRYVNEDFVD